VKEYYDSCIQYLVFGNVFKNNTYPLSVSAERTIQAKSLAEYALKSVQQPSLTEVQVQETTKFVLMGFSISFVRKWKSSRQFVI
jgi:hypothetical protein